MKPNRDANELAARLGAAASRPVPLPEDLPSPTLSTVQKRAKKATEKVTVAITLRPSRALLNRYTLAAADRTRKDGRVVSAQEVMIAVLEQGQLQ